MSRLDKIHIRDLALRCIVGITDLERKDKQDLLINLTLYANLQAAEASDQVEKTMNYREVCKAVIQHVENSQYHLIETLSQNIAELILKNHAVEKVTVIIDKPGALRFSRSVAVEITREKNDY